MFCLFMDSQNLIIVTFFAFIGSLKDDHLSLNQFVNFTLVIGFKMLKSLANQLIVEFFKSMFKPNLELTPTKKSQLKPLVEGQKVLI